MNDQHILAAITRFLSPLSEWHMAALLLYTLATGLWQSKVKPSRIKHVIASARVAHSFGPAMAALWLMSWFLVHDVHRALFVAGCWLLMTSPVINLIALYLSDGRKHANGLLPRAPIGGAALGRHSLNVPSLAANVAGSALLLTVAALWLMDLVGRVELTP